jgi:hypothetical protein
MNKISIILAFSFFVSGQVFACDKDTPAFSEIQNSGKHTISGPFSIEKLEQEHMVEIRETKQTLPFGYVNKEWNQLKSQYKDGDQFFFVKYEDGMFFMGQHVLVRHGCIIGVLIGAVS